MSHFIIFFILTKNTVHIKLVRIQYEIPILKNVFPSEWGI